jgi:SAM-dependent methyltransferase
MAEAHRDSFVAGQYFLAVAGMAAMRRILSRPAEGVPRIDEIRRVVEAYDEFPNNIVVEVVEHDVESGYTAWAPIYDGPNPAIAVEEPIVREMIRGLGPGRALDAGCGTGRHAGFLASQGFETVGVDATPGMLAVARANHPDVELREGRLEALPLEDDSVDVVVSSLAVCHATDLGAVIAEMARVVRPGGTVIVSDPHPTTVQFGGVANFRDPEADPTQGLTLPFVPNLLHPLHTYVNAAVAAGLEVVECQEPTFPEEGLAANPAYAILPDAVRQAFGGLPFIVIWRFRRRGGLGAPAS